MTEKEKQTDVDFKEFTADYWRERYLVVLEKVGEFTRKDIAKHDGYFYLALGKSSLSNVRLGIGGLEPTRRVVLALQKILDERAAAEKIAKKFMKRQKLATV